MLHANGLKTVIERRMEKKHAVLKISLTQSLEERNGGLSLR